MPAREETAGTDSAVGRSQAQVAERAPAPVPAWARAAPVRWVVERVAALLVAQPAERSVHSRNCRGKWLPGGSSRAFACRVPDRSCDPAIFQSIAAPAPGPMVWLILECILALLLFVFIVWWTLPAKRNDADKGDNEEH